MPQRQRVREKQKKRQLGEMERSGYATGKFIQVK